MKIQQPSDNSLYVTIGKYVYYFDDSIDGEPIVKRWLTQYRRTDDDAGVHDYCIEIDEEETE